MKEEKQFLFLQANNNQEIHPNWNLICMYIGHLDPVEVTNETRES